MTQLDRRIAERRYDGDHQQRGAAQQDAAIFWRTVCINVTRLSDTNEDASARRWRLTAFATVTVTSRIRPRLCVQRRLLGGWARKTATTTGRRLTRDGRPRPLFATVSDGDHGLTRHSATAIWRA
jgi:hypothetical protein